jgi:hypothetical protein
MAGYALMLGFRSNRKTRFLAQDWSPKAIVMYALASWVIGFYANVIIQFGVGDLNATGKQTLGAFGGFIALARMLDPLGVLMLIYSFLTTRKKAVLIVLLFMLLADFGLGFVADTKEMAVRGPLLFLFSYAILRDRLPIVATVIFVVLAGLTFNVFAAYRHELGSRHESRTHAVANIDSKLDKITGQNISLGQRLSDGLEYFAGRVTLKQNVELVVAKTGKEVTFQNGNTLTPVLLAFVPRFILPDKQDASQVGRIFNREFFHSGATNTYIAVSWPGELYWNFGWTGVVAGMMCIGMILASIASLAIGNKDINLPRFLLYLFTIYILILRSESALAMTFTVWARAAILLLLIHLLAPKQRASTTATSTLSNLRIGAPTAYSKAVIKP